MPVSQSLGGDSRAGKIIAPSLDRIIKNVAWRKNSQLVDSCKSVIDKLESVVDVGDLDSPPLCGFTASDADLVLEPLIIALDSGSIKVIEPAIDCVWKLFSIRLLGGEIDRVVGIGGGSTAVFRILEAVCKCCALGDEGVELFVLRTLLSAIRSPCLLIRGDYLLHMIRTCYNVYLGSSNGTNKICAKSALAQIMVIIFSRVEEDSMDVKCHTVSVYSLLEFTDKNLNEGSSIQFSQNFLNEIMESGEVNVDAKHQLSPARNLQNDNAVESKIEENGDIVHGDKHEASNYTGQSKIREDGFVVFKNICKLSMKFSSQEHTDDNILLRGKIISLELLKVVMDNAGPIWQSNERFLSSIKQYLCLSLLKNSALSVMTIFQLLCSIFTPLLKFRSVLKSEIGIFFPMLLLRVLENVLQPSFLQKMIVLNMLQKISKDSQIVIDIFVNYDCDVDSPNIFERIVNGLLKTALGPPTGSTSTLSTAQDSAFQVESVACLVNIIKSMGDWMDQQLKSNDSIEKRVEGFVSSEHHTILEDEEGICCDNELHVEPNTELSDAATLEQRRAYKIELQEGITLFNRKPHKGIEFLISKNKIGGSPEEVSDFFKSTTGLNKTLIGDYLGERDEFCLKVMHAYVDSFNFEEKNFGEAIRFFLQGFRLPGEAQKIDRIMEKFAERYCKCNPTAFSSAGTAYVLAYSVIMLNTDAHNDMVKDKMTKDDFVRNNRGIDNGKDLHEGYLGSLYDQIVKNEIKLKADSSVSENKQSNGFNKLLGLDGILNLVRWKQDEEKPVGANGALVRHIQEQFRAKSGKPGNIYYTLTDVSILRFMVEVCWGPMLAAFSVILDQSDDKASTSLCLQGFRLAIHVTSVIVMPTQRDAFVTTVAKFTYLHCAADMKQKNIDAVKTIISVAIEDGNYLMESWEHILTCLSRFEHLQLLGEGVPSDMSFFSNGEAEERTPRSIGFSSLKKKGTIQDPAMIAVVRGSSYDSTTPRFQTSNFVTPEQINHFILNLNLLEQVGSFELNHIFGHSQSLNSEAIVAFVKALCKVSVSELQSPTDPRVFSLTKIVEISHYNMSRIRLVWSHIWTILSEFFVSVGLSENLSVAIFVMDSLRQLAMKFLEREELANYNFQNEFLKPFVIVMDKSDSVEIRELIVRCISQMVLSRVSNVKSGWKSVFMVFTAAAADETKSIVLLAFETVEKIVREYFPYITETETSTFTDCVGCLLTFTNSTFNKDVSLNAIAFLRFCAVKLADGMLVSYDKSKEIECVCPNQTTSIGSSCMQKEDYVVFWIPMLTGLSKLASDTRSAIRKSSLKVLFNILKDHGHLFSESFWLLIFSSVVMPIFGSTAHTTEITSESQWTESIAWDSGTAATATQCLADLFISFFNVIRSQLPNVVLVLIGFIHNPVHGHSGTGIAALVYLAGELRNTLSENEWREFFLALKEASTSSLPGVSKILKAMDSVELPQIVKSHIDVQPSDEIFASDLDDDNLQTAAYIISRLKSYIAAELLVEQVATDLYTMCLRSLTAPTVRLILELFTSVASRAHRLTSMTEFRLKVQKVCTYLETSEPPLVHFETESSLNSLSFLHKLSVVNRPVSAELNSESLLVTECETILNMYLRCGGGEIQREGRRWAPPPLGSAQKEELGSRSGSVVSGLRALSGLTHDAFRKYASRLFPLLVGLVSVEHCSADVQTALTYVFESCIGPIIVD